MNITAAMMRTRRRAGTADLVIWVDGSRPPSAEATADIAAVCDVVDDRYEYGRVIVHVSGAPRRLLTGGLRTRLVKDWERALCRLEGLPVTTIAVASGDCGGTALEALLTTDYRIAVPDVRLLIPNGVGGAWPDVARYRLARMMGAAATCRAMQFGGTIDGRQALDVNLIDVLTEDTASVLAMIATPFTGPRHQGLPGQIPFLRS